jgi:putative spermidine/putrescine transport system substrate-binding protein
MLDSIKSDIIWWQAGAQPPQLLASHEVVMATAWNGRIQNPIDQEKKPFKIAWDNQIIEYDMIGIPKGAPHLDLAYKYLAFISQPENNGRLGQFIPYGPVVPAAAKFVPADTLAKLPTAPDHMKVVLVANVDFWGDHGEDLTKRFNAWLAK